MCRAQTVLAANRSECWCFATGVPSWISSTANLDWALINFMQDWFPLEVKAKHTNNIREATEEQFRELGYDPSRCLTM
jgi:hypothetical protein